MAIRRRRFWTDAEDATIRARYPHDRTTVIAKAQRRSPGAIYQRAYALGLHKSPEYLASPAACRTNGRQGMGTRFQKGQVPANKGLRRPGWGPGRMKETQFKQGERRGVAAKNWRPVGTILTDPEGYQRIKVREARYAVCFKNGDKANCALENLELVSRRDLMLRN